MKKSILDIFHGGIDDEQEEYDLSNHIVLHMNTDRFPQIIEQLPNLFKVILKMTK